MRHQIPVVVMEFDEGGKTIWVQSLEGTVLRVHAKEGIHISKGCVNNVPHADLLVNGPIHICMPSTPPKQSS